MKKNNLFIILLSSALILGSIVPSVSAQGRWSLSDFFSKKEATYNEAEACMNILADYVQKDTRFGGENLRSAAVPVDGKTYRADLTNFEFSPIKAGFRHVRSINKANGTTYYHANRNNIGTISTSEQYLMTEIVGYGNQTSFNFPYKDPTTNQTSHMDRLTDSHNIFREKLVYNHYLKGKDGARWKLVSCGFIKITPKNGFGHNATLASNYKTNFIDASGFELLKGQANPEVRDGKRFIVGKANVPMRNYNDEHHMSLEIVTVAYDNKSSYMNEFETFPLQVKAMTNEDVKGDVNKVQERFLELVQSETCLRIAHANESTLSPKCDGQFKSLTAEGKTTASLNKNFFDFLIPTANAQESEVIAEWVPPMPTEESQYMEDPEAPEDYSHLSQGMYAADGLTKEALDKINSLGDPLLKAHILKALGNGVEEVMKKNAEGNSPSAHDNRVFLQCGMDYNTRVKLISEWIDSIDVGTFDINNITYPDPKMGDCLLPYPDARHKDKIIENSFLTNQYNAAIRTDNKEKIAELAPVLQMGEYAKTDIIGDKSMNSNIVLVLGGILILGGASLLMFLLRNKKAKNK